MFFWHEGPGSHLILLLIRFWPGRTLLGLRSCVAPKRGISWTKTGNLEDLKIIWGQELRYRDIPGRRHSTGKDVRSKTIWPGWGGLCSWAQYQTVQDREQSWGTPHTGLIHPLLLEIPIAAMDKFCPQDTKPFRGSWVIMVALGRANYNRPTNHRMPPWVHSPVLLQLISLDTWNPSCCSLAPHALYPECLHSFLFISTTTISLQATMTFSKKYCALLQSFLPVSASLLISPIQVSTQQEWVLPHTFTENLVNR